MIVVSNLMMLTFWRTFKKIHVTDNSSIILAGNKYWGKKLAFYNAGQNIWSRVRNPVKLDRTIMFDIYFCVFFDCYCQSLNSGRETGHWAMSPPKFEIFQLFPKILSLFFLPGHTGPPIFFFLV